MKCTHGQRWEHWIPLFHGNEMGKVVCGSDRDIFVDTERECRCPEDCTCKDKNVPWNWSRKRKA